MLVEKWASQALTGSLGFVSQRESWRHSAWAVLGPGGTGGGVHPAPHLTRLAFEVLTV